jgi:hypothetical protein
VIFQKNKDKVFTENWMAFGLSAGFGGEERSSLLLFIIIYAGRKRRVGKTKNNFRKNNQQW